MANPKPQQQERPLRLCIHESSMERCLARGLTRFQSGKLSWMSVGDPLLSYPNADMIVGQVASVVPVRVDHEWWFYTVMYIPVPGSSHPLDGFVVWREDVAAPVVANDTRVAAAPQQPTRSVVIPEADEMRVTSVAPSINHNGKNRVFQKQVTGQPRHTAPASAVAMPTV